MKSCSIPLCANDSNKRPDLKYFALPRNVNIREEWLEVIGVKGNYRGQNLSICENHFSDLDFKAGKKELKSHAVPVVDVGEDEFVHHVFDSIPEIMEIVPTEEVAKEQTTPASTKKKTSSEEKSLPEPTPETECAPGRRPSRRAAVEAAKKIFNTVRNYNIKDLHAPAEEAPLQPPVPKAPAAPSADKKVKKRRRNYDLDMYCEGDELSAIQTTCQHNAQNSFNLAMKNFRELTACNVRITQTGPNPVNFNVSVNVFADDDDDIPVKSKSKINNRPLSKAHVPNVYPVLLTKVSNLSQTPIIYV